MAATSENGGQAVEKFVNGSSQTIPSNKGDWELVVARQPGGETFTFDTRMPHSHISLMGDIGTGTAISCHNLTRAHLEEHIARCQAALVGDFDV